MKVSKMEVFKEVIRITLNYESDGVAHIGALARRLNTTPYYVRKRIKTLIEDGYLVKGISKGGFCELSYKPYPPLKGYCLTAKAHALELYSTLEKEEEEAFAKAFGW
ncbi:MarR family transcriptional regulator [Psychrobacillus sp. FJAT-21963]|uniref:MarR family transcriptional regulator n=1 Tax=Psychrobacillus sp. FJAT-21963 TaxID=1712028 RepID=UPI0006F36014|nr:MarR family transcriptional regulator [Psychrobacillus sp. FJAT-21963]KQL37148.1 hypothetical protein AN959_03665 [Psychrobacillus sp. FJAT-21963]